MNSRAQSAIEFTIITSVSLLIFSVAFIVVEQNVVSAQKTSFENDVSEILDFVESEIILASQMGPGYSRTIRLPSSFNGYPYDLQFTDHPNSNARDELELILEFPSQSNFRFLLAELDLAGNLNLCVEPGELSFDVLGTGEVVLIPENTC